MLGESITCCPCSRNHITFIVGENGSGKSAVMQGLQFCLGATAKGTGRASKLNQVSLVSQTQHSRVVAGHMSVLFAQDKRHLHGISDLMCSK